MMTTGGVCAVLDYELDQMTEYVAEMAQRIVLPTNPVSPAFRKFVSGLLSSTRLPKTTILLGMNYLARRTNMLNAAGQNPAVAKAGEGAVWRMLTIGLLLGSKFLDDNTFQNRSWSEVSGIQVSELNTMETEWLEAMNYCLYVNLDKTKDFQAWLENWAEWRETKNIERKATLDRLTQAPLASIDANAQRVRPQVQIPIFPGYKAIPSARPESEYTHYWDWNTQSYLPKYPSPHLTPPSAPDSAIHTPEYLSATGGGPQLDWTMFNQYAYHQTPAYVPAAYPTPYTQYGHHYNANIWDAQNECTCHHCNGHAKQGYFMGHGTFGQQIVAG